MWSILPCLARYGPDARSLEACLGLRLGRLLVAYATTVIPSHKSVKVKNIVEMQIVSEPNNVPKQDKNIPRIENVPEQIKMF